MAHALEMQDGQVAFALRGEPAWHGLANVLFDKDEHINTQTMLDSAKLSNWDIQLEDIALPTDIAQTKLTILFHALIHLIMVKMCLQL